MAAEPTYRSDTRPDFAPFEDRPGRSPGFAYAGDLAPSCAGGIDGAAARSTCSTTCWPSASSRR